MCNCAREQHRAVEPGPDLLDQREWGERSGMSTGTGGHGDDTVGALLHGFVRELVVDDVMEDDAAVGVHSLVDLFSCAQ
ncbi:hypothetical protein [Brevibacterium sp. UCMA 11754]|uniref:hypothetical protein n=1 Tax=Brevibacterium sp. UCMA 11754 TaxID=2749198 RepID=UPI001F298743|nr:hypothetical protein [Brevibacterium sp. UCMA 11754]